MILGFLLAAIVSGAVVSASLLVIGAPLWVVLVAYPASGIAVLVFAASAASFCRGFRDGGTTEVDHFPVQRSTTENVAASTRISVAKERERS
jgi:hypothetical protein